MKKSSASSEASPYKSVAEELERLRKTFRSLSQRYTVRIEAEISGLRDTVLAAAHSSPAAAGRPVPGAGPDAASALEAASASGENGSARPKTKAPTQSAAAKLGAAERQTSQFHDLRDMLTLLRTFEVTSPVAGRRDFKRVESILEELQLLARHWA